MDNQNMNPAQTAPEQAPSIPGGSGDKKFPMSLLLVILGALVVTGAVMFWLRQQEEQLPLYVPEAPVLDADLDADLKQAEPANLDNEFQAVDAEINSL